MRYKASLFNTIGILGLLLTFGYTIYHWGALSKGEGWGLVAMFAYILFASSALLIDLLLQFFIKNKWLLNAIEIIILLILFSYFKADFYNSPTSNF